MYLRLLLLPAFGVAIGGSSSYGQAGPPATGLEITISDFNPDRHKRFIDLTLIRSPRPRKEQVPISGSGRAVLYFLNSGPVEVVAKLENRAFSLLALPDDQIKLTLKADEWLDRMRFTEVVVTGRAAHTNRLMLSYENFIIRLLNRATKPFARPGEHTHEEYRHLRMQEYRWQMQQLDSLLQAHRIGDTAFIDWARARIRYRAGEDLLVRPFIGRINRELYAGSHYFSFIAELRPQNPEKILYQSRIDYLKKLSNTALIMSNTSNHYRNIREERKVFRSNQYALMFALLDSLALPEDRDMAWAVAYVVHGRNMGNYRDTIRARLDSDMWEQIRIEEKNTEERNIIALLEDYPIASAEKAELLDFYREAAGKVIFHDFWFSSCAPCMEELPHYNKLTERAGEGIVFVFMGTYMEEEEWQQTLAGLKLKGKHFLLNKNQLAFYEKYFQVQSFPHHQVVDEQGYISGKVQYRVLDDNIPAILDFLNKIANQR